MQQTWPHEDKVQFCRWFLGLDDTADLMAELGEEPEEDNNQLEFDFEKGHDDEETEAPSNTRSPQVKGTIQ